MTLFLLAALTFEAVFSGPKLENFATAEKYLPETMAGGIGVFDYNNDGRLDIFTTNGADLRTGRKASNHLLRNDGNFKFTDVTAQAHLEGEGFATGVAAADYDGDGFVDLLVAAIPRARLYRNKGDGTFVDVTARAGIPTSPWTVAAGWFDMDNDGKPDLFLVNYLNWSLGNNPWCGDPVRKLRVYCHPKQFQPLSNALLRNKGDGTFEDVSVKSGVAAHKGKGMSVAFADYDVDGFTDIFVTNDVLPNFLFRNLGNGRFEESALIAGVSLPDAGKPVSAMGAEFADFNNDGLQDLIYTALAGESFPLFRNSKGGNFTDVTASSKMTSLTMKLSGWGVAAADLDNDSYSDIVTCNSHVNDLIESTSADQYLQNVTVFHNSGGRSFQPLTLGDRRAWRGCLAADFDNDGRLDIVASALGQPLQVWRNTTANPGRFISLDAPGGSTVRLGTRSFFQSTAHGYSSSAVTKIHIGVGDVLTLPQIDIFSPSRPPKKLTSIKSVIVNVNAQ